MTNYLGAVGVGELARALRNAPAEVRRELRPALRRAGGFVKTAAAANASWSSRIPASLTVLTSSREGSAAVSIAARASVAPHARPFEGIGGAASFRHPVFGHDVWVSQACRPFLRPAVVSEQPRVVAEIADAAAAAVGRL